MKKTAAIISACMLTFALSACSGSNYVMHTNDGRTIVSDGKPQTDNDTGMIFRIKTLMATNSRSTVLT